MTKFSLLHISLVFLVKDEVPFSFRVVGMPISRLYNSISFLWNCFTHQNFRRSLLLVAHAYCYVLDQFFALILFNSLVISIKARNFWIEFETWCMKELSQFALLLWLKLILKLCFHFHKFHFSEKSLCIIFEPLRYHAHQINTEYIYIYIQIENENERTEAPSFIC